MELDRHDGTTFVDCTKTIAEYIGGSDWRIKANSNSTYSNASLVNNTAGKVIANYWLDAVYSPEEGLAHREGKYHIHDLDSLTGYCAGWNLRKLLDEGFNGVRSRVNSNAPKHLSSALGQMANFLGILQSEWAGAQAFSSFDTFLAPYVFRDKLDLKAVRDLVECFVYNLNVPSRWGQCVPENYRCLKADGTWVSYENLNIGDEIVVIDPKTGKPGIDVITHVNVFDAPEKMHKYYNKHGFNFSVTDRHRVIYKTGSNDYIIKESRELMGRDIVDIPIARWADMTPEEFMGKEFDIDDELLEFIAFIMCDGCIVKSKGRSTRIDFYKSNNRYGCDRFEYLCKVLDIPYSIAETQGDFNTVCNRYMLKKCETVDKVVNMLEGDKHRVPFFMQYLSPRQANIVVDTWVKLDGHFDGQAHWKMQCDNNDIQDMLAYLVFKTGKAVSVTSRIVGENKTPTLYANVHKRGCRTCHIEEVNTDCDKVWCPTTNTGTFVCMTDEGYVFITGNSPFTNITIDWSVPDDLKDQMPTRNGDHLFEDLIDDEELCQKAKERGCDDLTDMCYKDFVPEMHILQKAYYEVMSDGDTKGQPFTFPIPTVNVTEEFDWNSPNIGVLFENTAKRGSSYFQNFVGSQYKRDENGNLVPDEEAYKPSAVRSMCPLTANTKVLTKTAWEITFKKIGEMYSRANQGTKYSVFAGGDWHECNIINAGKQSIYNITLSNNEILEFGELHLQPVLRDEKELTISAKDIMVGDWLPFNTTPVEGIMKNSSKELGFVIGAYLGDGSVDDCNGINYSFSADSKDDETEARVRTFFESIGYRVSTKVVNNLRSVRVGAGSFKLIEKYITGSTALDKGIINTITTYSKETRMGIIEGLIATDGQRKNNRISTSSENMVESIINLCASIGIKAYKSYEDTRDNRLGTNTNYMVSIILDRQNLKDKFMTVNGTTYYKVIKVENTNNIQTTYCVELPDDETNDHTFVLANGLITHNCRLQLDLRELQRRGNGLFGSAESTGSVGVVTINLARLGYLHKGDKRGLYKELDHLMDMAKSTLEKKRVVVNDLFERGLYPYTKRYLSAGFRNHFSTIGINGMNELIRNYTNDKHNIADEKGKAMALEIINHMREKLRKYQEDTGNLYNLEASPSEGACHRFAREDAKRYTDIIQAGYEGHNYYTNSSQLTSSYSDNLFTVLEHQNELQPLYTGGSVLHLYMGEAVSSADACKSLVQKVLKNYRVPYITVTPTFSVCEKHGYISGKHEYCPYCDMELIQEERAKMKDDLSK